MLITSQVIARFIAVSAQLDTIGDLQTKTMNDLVRRVRESFDKTIEKINAQGWIQLGFGLGGGVTSLGGPLLKQAEAAKAIGECLRSGQGILSTFMQASQTKHQQEGNLGREHKLPTVRDAKSGTSGQQQQLQHSTEKVLENEAAAYRS
jgi:hypothetical protein